MDRQSQSGFLAGNGVMAAMIRAKNWSDTPLGPIENWPQSLRTTVSLCLASNFPINIVWGPAHTQIYNDGYRVVCGDAHPRALGAGYNVTWASAWPAVGDSFTQALAGETSFLENQRMFLTRNGYLEETFFTFSLSPIVDESGGIGGLFHPVTETTATMLAERRTRALRDLGATLAPAADLPELARLARTTLARFEFDLPFLLVYALSDDGQRYELAEHHGLSSGSGPFPRSFDAASGSPWGSLAERRETSLSLPPGSCGPYEEPPERAFILPVLTPHAERPLLLAVAGASPRLPFDDAYRGFFELLGAGLAAALGTVTAREGERRRAEALAELDRAKTAFFSNVSHEFRTPLTLMLSPLEDMQATAERLPQEDRDRLALAHRNGLRLLRLVNALLDFSRVEAGREQAFLELTDLSAYTADLASNFRSACERAGLALVIDAPPLPAPVRIDRGMWEKVLLNLLSNAFKFTFAGEIRVAVRPSADGKSAEVAVSDTGTGIPAGEIGRIFERFHRVEGASGRSFEGSGIGLALVRELVGLHGGTIEVASGPGRGTTFTVRLPIAVVPATDSPAKPMVPQETLAHAFVEEALAWLPDDASGAGDAAAPPPDGPMLQGVTAGVRGSILLADDNADMRGYVQRLLTVEGFAVQAVRDGEAALDAMRRRPPDLLLSDVMMPRLDGFGLLRAIRADAHLRQTPVILLSARAGEEARVEGLEAGADDYLVKPFAARELVTRVASTLTLARNRREATLRESEEQLRLATDAAEVGLWDVDGATGALFWPPRVKAMFGISADVAVSLADFYSGLHPEDRDRVGAFYSAAADSLQRAIYDVEYRTIGKEDGVVRWVAAKGRGVFNSNGKLLRVIGTAIDITERKQAEEALRQSEAKLRALNEDLERQVTERARDRARTWQVSPDLLSVITEDGRFESVNPAWSATLGWPRDTLEGSRYAAYVHPEDAGGTAAAWRQLLRGDPVLRFENRYRRQGGGWRWLSWLAVPEGGKIYCSARDVTSDKEQEAELTQRTAERDRLWRYSQDLMVIIDTAGNFQAVSPVVTTILDLAPEDLIGCNVLDVIHPDDRAPSLRALERATATTIPSFENRYRHRDGTYRWLSWVAAPEGNLIYATARHITAEKEQAEALRQAEEQLRQAQKMEAVGQLTGGLAHDFNNLLTGITGSLELLQTRIGQGRLGEVERYVEAAQSAAKRAAALTHRLLAFSRRQTLDPKPVGLNRLVAGMEDLVRRTMGPAIAVEVVVSAGLWTTLIDPSQLESALLNLCINARDAMPDGGRLTIETANTWLDERGARERELPPGQYVTLAVTDTGTGMTADVIRRAFDPFYTTKPIGMGTGLGLSMVYGFARQSGGQARIYSEVGSGTTVRLYLPRHLGAEEHLPDAAEAAQLPHAAGGETVLIVDDEPTVRMLVTEVLADMGVAALQAVDGASGLAVLQSEARVDLLVSDVGLPGGMNGRQMADAARAMRPELKVLFITGYAENAVVGNGHLAAGMHVMTKPFAMEALASRIKEIIEAKP